MLKLTLKAGEYLLIGDGIKVVYTGGSNNNGHLLVDATKSMNIARSGALQKRGLTAESGTELVKHHKDRQLSPEAQAKIRAILMEEKKKAKMAER